MFSLLDFRENGLTLAPDFSNHDMFFNTSFLAALFLVASVNAHGVVTEIQGANGVKGVGFGVSDLSGKNLRLFNQVSDST